MRETPVETISGRAAVHGEDIPHQFADMLGAALVKYEYRRAGAAQSAAQQPRLAQPQNFGQPRNQLRAEGLMQAVVERRGKTDASPVASAATSNAARCTLKTVSASE